MINLIIFFIIFIIIIYIVFHLFVQLFKSFHLIDDYFTSKIKNVEDFFVKKLLDNSNTKNIENLNELEDKKRKKLNMFLRFDFLISIVLGIFWFLFPFFVLNVKLKGTGRYLGKYLGLFTLISCYLPLFNVQKKEISEKKKVLITKLFIILIIILTFFIHVYYLDKINPYSIISLFFTTIWMGSTLLGIYEAYDLDKKF